MRWRPPAPTLFPYTTLFRSLLGLGLRNFSMHPSQLLPIKERILRTNLAEVQALAPRVDLGEVGAQDTLDRKSTRLNSSHQISSYAVFCLQKKHPRPPPALQP